MIFNRAIFDNAKNDIEINEICSRYVGIWKGKYKNLWYGCVHVWKEMTIS